MDILTKLSILGEAARYDASCASSGSRRQAPADGVGNTSSGGICHSWSDDGRCISLLKILFSNVCQYDCAYCLNRRSNDVPRASFTVRDVVDLTLNFYRRNYIEGLFLSSGVFGSPDQTMEQLVRVVELLRREHRFGGYIHLKAIPGASPELVRRAGLCVDRLSVNIELPSEASLCRLAPEKTRDSILKPMSWIHDGIAARRDERHGTRRAHAFAPAGQSTQLIVGASPETDIQILRLTDGLYRKFALKRVYFSAYMPVGNERLLPALLQPPLRREHRLYQADWLMRLYGFDVDEILAPDTPFLDEALDPKAGWALRNPHRFPVDVNRADYEMLLRVPGIGLRSASRIVAARRHGQLRYADLKTLGVVLKRARFFVACPDAPRDIDILPRAPERIRMRLADDTTSGHVLGPWQQLLLPLHSQQVVSARPVLALPSAQALVEA